MQRSRALTALTTLAVAVLLAGCSNPGDVPAGASAAEPGRTFGACPAGAPATAAIQSTR